MHEAMKTAVLRLISARAVIGMNRACTPRSSAASRRLMNRSGGVTLGSNTNYVRGHEGQC